MAERSDIRKLMTRRSNLVDGLLSVLERKVQESERTLLNSTVSQFIDRLQLTDDGRVRNTLYNKRLLANIDTVFDRFGKTAGVEIASMIATGVQSVVNFNGEYYKAFSTQAQLLPINKNVKDFMSSWLGLTKSGTVKPNGYLDTLIKDTTVKNQVKDFALRSVVGQRGWMEAKNELGKMIAGGDGKTGRLSQYYRNFVYDTYSQVDRATGEVYAEKLGLEFAIYEGGIIKTTRTFCRERNGKVFHRSEIEKFNPKVAKPPNYNPFTDLGGYGCRHHLNWIPNAVAFAMRPDARGKFGQGQQQPQPAQQSQIAQQQQRVEKVEPTTQQATQQAKAPRTQREFIKQQSERIKTANAEVDKLKSEAAARVHLRNLFKQLGTGDRDVNVTISRSIGLDGSKTYLKAVNELFETYDTSSLSKLAEVKFASSPRTFGSVARLAAGGDVVRINFGSNYDRGRVNDLSGASKITYQFKSRVDEANLKISTATHEFAHVIASTSDTRSRAFFMKLQMLRREYHDQLNKFIREGNVDAAADIYLGKYASTNPDEFWAEAFTEYRLSSKPSKYAKLVGKLGDKYFKKRLKK